MQQLGQINSFEINYKQSTDRCSSTKNICTIPNDLIKEIFKYLLEPKDWNAFIRTCKIFNKIGTDQIFTVENLYKEINKQNLIENVNEIVLSTLLRNLQYRIDISQNEHKKHADLKSIQHLYKFEFQQLKEEIQKILIMYYNCKNDIANLKYLYINSESFLDDFKKYVDLNPHILNFDYEIINMILSYGEVSEECSTAEFTNSIQEHRKINSVKTDIILSLFEDYGFCSDLCCTTIFEAIVSQRKSYHPDINPTNMPNQTRVIEQSQELKSMVLENLDFFENNAILLHNLFINAEYIRWEDDFLMSALKKLNQQLANNLPNADNIPPIYFVTNLINFLECIIARGSEKIKTNNLPQYNNIFSELISKTNEYGNLYCSFAKTRPIEELFS